MIEATLAVDSVECGATDVEGFFDPVPATVGHYCIVNYTVTNTGSVPADLDLKWEDTAVVDTDGRTFNASFDGTSAYTIQNDMDLVDVQPTQTASAAVLFDVPLDAEIELMTIPAWDVSVSVLTTAVGSTDAAATAAAPVSVDEPYDHQCSDGTWKPDASECTVNLGYEPDLNDGEGGLPGQVDTAPGYDEGSAAHDEAIADMVCPGPGCAAGSSVPSTHPDTDTPGTVDPATGEEYADPCRESPVSLDECV